jgi:adenine-specific DNA-methyltransferase
VRRVNVPTTGLTFGHLTGKPLRLFNQALMVISIIAITRAPKAFSDVENVANYMIDRGLTEFAAEQQRQFDISTSPAARKACGHFGTRPAIAEFMAMMFSQIPEGRLRILDPGAGVGMLSAAVCQRILNQAAPCHVEIELWETDLKLERYLRNTMEHCRRALCDAGHVMKYTVRFEDFILANTKETLFDDGPGPSFDLTILNPPYYKVRKGSPEARAMEHVVHGQPNIYAFFMAVAA